MRNFKKLIAVVSALALLLTVFSGINMFASADYVANPAKELADFKAAMETKATLTAGTYVEAGDTEYYHGMLRTREGPNGTWDPAFEDYTAVAEMAVGHWGMTHPAGSLFGLVVNKTVGYTSNDLWLGASTVYNVVPGTYVATVVNANTAATYADGTFAEKFRYETSADGETWTTLTATIKDAHPWTTSFCQAAYAIAIVQIPEGAKYYRITMPGFDETRITNALKDDSLWSASGYDTSAGVEGFTPVIKGYGIGSVIASACDLTAVTNYTEITDYTFVAPEVRAFQKAMAQKEVLTAGKLAEIADTDTWLGMVRSKANPNQQTNSDPITPFAEWTHFVDAHDWNANNNLGNLFGVVNEKTVTHNSASCAWQGATVVYNVVPGTYVATVLNMSPDIWANGMENGFRFEVSATGASWEVVNATVTAISGWASDCQMGYGKAVVQIPEGMKYYRITMKDFNTSVENGNLWEENLWTPATFAADSNWTAFVGYGIGMSIASNDNLNNVTNYSEISDGYNVTAPAGVTVSKSTGVKKRETITITVADNLVAGSLKANGVAVFAKGDTDEAGEGAGNVFKYTLTENADVVITAEFKDAADIAVEDNFATVAASINTDTRALRFLNRVYVEGGKVRIGEDLYTVKGFGALIVPEYMLTDWDYTAEDLDHSKVDDGEVYAVDVAVNVLYDKTAKYVDFTTGVRGLAEYTQVEDILVRAYVIYEDANGAEQYAYADVQRANYAALNGGETTPEA